MMAPKKLHCSWWAETVLVLCLAGLVVGSVNSDISSTLSATESGATVASQSWWPGWWWSSTRNPSEATVVSQSEGPSETLRSETILTETIQEEKSNVQATESPPSTGSWFYLNPLAYFWPSTSQTLPEISQETFSEIVKDIEDTYENDGDRRLAMSSVLSNSVLAFELTETNASFQMMASEVEEGRDPSTFGISSDASIFPLTAAEVEEGRDPSSLGFSSDASIFLPTAAEVEEGRDPSTFGFGSDASIFHLTAAKEEEGRDSSTLEFQSDTHSTLEEPSPVPLQLPKPVGASIPEPPKMLIKIPQNRLIVRKKTQKMPVTPKVQPDDIARQASVEFLRRFGHLKEKADKDADERMKKFNSDFMHNLVHNQESRLARTLTRRLFEEKQVEESKKHKASFLSEMSSFLEVLRERSEVHSIECKPKLITAAPKDEEGRNEKIAKPFSAAPQPPIGPAKERARSSKPKQPKKPASGRPASQNDHMAELKQVLKAKKKAAKQKLTGKGK